MGYLEIYSSKGIVICFLVIIVDSGSTKADWCIVEDGFVLSNVTTQGISPVHQSSDVIVEIVRKQLFVDTTFCQTLSQ